MSKSHIILLSSSENKLNDTLVLIIKEFIQYKDINIVAEKVHISPIQIKRWYRKGKRGDEDYKDFYEILLKINPNMEIIEYKQKKEVYDEIKKLPPNLLTHNMILTHDEENSNEFGNIDEISNFEDKWKSCPKCKKQINIVAKKCPYCNYNFKIDTTNKVHEETSTLTNNFVNNTASENGGAVYFVSSAGTVTNCNFVNNTASENGGALYGGTANNCIFNDNHADQFGGAIYHGDVEGSTFTNNSAYIGGAIYNCSAVNCNFTGTTAHDGGAVAISMVSNCTFNNNSALALGGAAVNSSATQCIFINNTANEGEALCLGSQILCTFINNNCSQTNSLAFKVSDFTAYYKSGKKLLVGLICDGKTFDGISTTLNVYQNDALIGTYHCLSGDGWVVNLNPGIYNVVLSVDEHQDIEPVNVTLTILKFPTTIYASAVSTVYNGGKYLVVTLKDADGKVLNGVKVTIKLSNGKTYNLITNNNGQVKLITNALAPVKTYKATIIFAGDNNYAKSNKTVNIVVKKANPKIIAIAKTFKRTVKTKNYAITLKTNQNKVMKNCIVYLNVNKKIYAAKTNSKGVATFKITKLTKKGRYTAVVTYKGNAYYNKLTKKVKIAVK